MPLASAPFPPRSVLIVDSDESVRRHLSNLLSRAGHQTTVADHANAALEAAVRLSFDLVIAELELPGVDGLALISRLRARDPEQEFLLLGRTADANIRAARAGVMDCLLKPLEDGEVQLKVDRALERAALRRERGRLLDENREFARDQSVSQHALDLLSNLDLEWLQERILTHLGAVCDAQSAALWLMDERGELVLRAYQGLVDKRFLSDRIEVAGTWSERLREGALWTNGEGRARMLLIPLLARGEVVGLAQLSDPLTGDFSPEHCRAGKMLGDFAAVSLRNGRRFLALQRLGLRDKDTAAYNLSYFTDYAGKEIYKARRYGRVFSLLTFSIDNLPQVKARLGPSDAQRAQRAIIRALSKIVRDSDVLAKASEQEFYLLLPETDYFGALMFVRRAEATLRDDPEVQSLESRLPLALVGGAGSFPKDGDDFDELVHRCRRRMEERRVSLQRRLMLDGLGFWEEVELLLGSSNSPKLPTDDRAEPSRRGKVSDALFDDLQSEIARELSRDPSARGVLYIGGPEVRAGLPIVEALSSASSELMSRVYVLGRRADLDNHPALTPVFLEGDEHMNRHEFIFWLSEYAAYGLIQQRGLGATWGFHTSDTAVVDGLIAKLQAEYDLQPY